MRGGGVLRLRQEGARVHLEAGRPGGASAPPGPGKSGRSAERGNRYGKVPPEKSPLLPSCTAWDTDSICSAIAYSRLKNILNPNQPCKPCRAGLLNRETEFVLDYFKVPQPQLYTDVSPPTSPGEMDFSICSPCGGGHQGNGFRAPPVFSRAG